MAGGFTHLTLVDSICQGGDRLDKIEALTKSMKAGLMEFLNYCELGAVSPDCPYLSFTKMDAVRWANVMHYWKTGDFIRSGVRWLSERDPDDADTKRCYAWLFGYTAHVVVDLTIHPVINLKVGKYEENKERHRICEMNQDVYIYHKQGFGELSQVEFWKTGVIPEEIKCGSAVYDLWNACLLSFPPETIHMKDGLESPRATPEPDEWVKLYVKMMDKVAEEGGRFLPVFRKFMEDKGAFYLDLKDVDQQYIRGLLTPEKTLMDFDVLFEKARENVIKAWRELGTAITNKDVNRVRMQNGDLDTGKNEKGEFIFWSR